MKLQEVKWMISLRVYLSTLNKLCGKGHCLSRLLEEKTSISILLKKLSILLNSTKHVLGILHALFHLMKNKNQ